MLSRSSTDSDLPAGAIGPRQAPLRILIADDDLELCALLVAFLRDENFVVDAVHDGATALARLCEPATHPDLLILDVTMPGRDGLETLRELRLRDDLPVVMLSARGEPADRAMGLEIGADDYLSKPFLPRELLARIRVQLRKQQRAPAQQLLLGALQIDLLERRVRIDGRELRLTAAEFTVLRVLAQSAGSVVGKAMLTQLALGRDIERFDRSLDVHVSRLRRKLAEASPLAPMMESIRGVGYLMHRPSDGAS